MSSFTKKLAHANRLSPAHLFHILRRYGVRNVRYVDRSPVYLDKRGSDYRIHGFDRTVRHVDLKEATYAPDADRRVVIETKMIGRQIRPGWALDPRKITDLVVVRWKDGSTAILPYKKLRSIARARLPKWRRSYEERTNYSDGFYERFGAQFLLIPHRDLKAQLYC